jgi:hypothetical protein
VIGSAGKIDAVLPLAPRDFERAQILFRSLELFFEPLGVLWIVVPDASLSGLDRGRLPARARVLPESALLQELPFYRALFRGSYVFRRRPDGWYVQQLVKMSAPSVVETDFYLSLDSDISCVRPVRYADLVTDGRSLCQRYGPSDIHAEWYEWSERVLGLKRSAWSHGVTPILYSRDGMRELHAFLETRVAGAFRLLPWPSSRGPNPWTSWRGLLIRNLPWAEHTLYYIFLEIRGLFERYHVPLVGRCLYDGDVTQPGDFDSWPGPILSDAGLGPYFTTVQSWLKIPPAEVWRRLRPVLVANGAPPGLVADLWG